METDHVGFYYEYLKHEYGDTQIVVYEYGIVDDLMSETIRFVPNILTKISLYVTYKLLDKNRFAKTITLNAHYYVHLNTHETPSSLQRWPDKCIRTTRHLQWKHTERNQRSVRISAVHP